MTTTADRDAQTETPFTHHAMGSGQEEMETLSRQIIVRWV